MTDLEPWTDPALRGAAFRERSPAEEARVERRIFAAIAADRQLWQRRRSVRRALGGGLLAACFALVVATVMHAPPLDLRIARLVVPEVSALVSTQVGGVVSASPARLAPPAPATDAGP